MMKTSTIKPAHDHMPRCERGFYVLLVHVGLRPSTPILNCQLDRHPDMNNNRSKQEQTNCPKQRAEIAQMLRVTVDPIRSDKNLQIPEQMSDHKKNQNDAGDRDDHFFPNRRVIKSR